ncbi:MAG: Xaa-Pro peptidase family protein [Dehalococcoidia bacterium]|nr:Xaa-Pro peptidase family protein [Dehalococcoidia bacterium]
MRLFDYDRLSEEMHKRGIDVLLAGTKPNVEYLTDVEWMRWFDKENFLTEDGEHYAAAFVGLPQDESDGPFYVAPSTQTGYPENYNIWIDDVRYWGPVFFVAGSTEQMETADNPIARVAQVLREKGLDRGRIGVEWRHLEMQFAEDLREYLPMATLVDAEPVLWELRIIKSEEEINRIRRASDITSEVINSIYADAAYEGMTEWDLERYLGVAFAERGSRHLWTDVGFGPKGARFAGPTDEKLRRGDILRIDASGWWDGYVSDQSRSLAWDGDLSDAAKRGHAAIYRMNRELREAVRPGVLPSDLYRLTMRLFEEEGFDSLTPQAGHSLGRIAHEPPFLVEGSDRPLEPGMIVVVEPTMRLEGVGSINIEDTTVVTEDGCEVLTSTPREWDAFL